jgi:hypothetical protein
MAEVIRDEVKKRCPEAARAMGNHAGADVNATNGAA